jgi:hypothetical protein
MRLSPLLGRVNPRFTMLAVVALSWAAPVRAAPAEKPRLVVLLSVDQLRGDYPSLYGHQWTRGLKTLFGKGAHFTNARYPYLHTVTCAGHVTIGTGAFPNHHGMVFNGWWVEAERKVIPCTTDATAHNISYGKPLTGPGDSARNIVVPTLADAMKAGLRPTPRVFSASMKARSAIGLVGAAGDVVTFLDGGSFVTSSIYALRPDPLVQRELDGFTPKRLLARPWLRAQPESRYLSLDDGPHEYVPVSFWTRVFPHPLRPPESAGATESAREALALKAWAYSPFPDEVLVALAKAGLTKMGLGRRGSVDVLALSFSALDTVGHAFGPDSHEVQDVLMRLDGLLGDLLAALDVAAGRGRYLLALTADHGVAPYPEALVAQGKDAGRVSGDLLRKSVSQALVAELGPGNHLSQVLYTDLYLAPGTYDRLKQRPGALARVLAVVRAAPGVAAVFHEDQLRSPVPPTDPVARAAALSPFPGRSGQIVFAPRPNWLTTQTGTTHGTQHDYDQHVPVVLYGAGVRPGRYQQPATPADIAVTMAAQVGVALPTADGRVLTEALLAAPAVAPPVRPR